jgi:hypothetical protein
MAIDLRIFDRNYRPGNPYAYGTPQYNAQNSFAAMSGVPAGGNTYTPGTNAYKAQSAFEAMSAAAEKNVIRDPKTKGVLGYTEAAGVTPLPGQTINIYNPAGTEVIRTQTGQPLQQSQTGGTGGGINGKINTSLDDFRFYPYFDTSSMMSGFKDFMASTEKSQQDFFNSLARYNAQAPQQQTASVQTAAPQGRRMGSIGSSFRRGGMRIKSVNI